MRAQEMRRCVSAIDFKEDERIFSVLDETSLSSCKHFSLEVLETLHGHALKLKNQPQEFAGVFRTDELAVGDDVVMAASAVPGAMQGFITWLNANDQDCEDVASFAANAHFKLVLETLRRHTLMIMNQPPEFAGVFALMKE